MAKRRKLVMRVAWRDITPRAFTLLEDSFLEAEVDGDKEEVRFYEVPMYTLKQAAAKLKQKKVRRA